MTVRKLLLVLSLFVCAPALSDTIAIVGNDKAAKEKVATMVAKMGLKSIDLGPIEVAHWTEYGVVVALNNEFSERANFDMVFREIE